MPTSKKSSAKNYDNLDKTDLNFNLFGRSNTLDRQLKPLNPIALTSKSVDSKNISTNETPNSPSQKNQYQQPPTTPQRNSLINLKNNMTYNNPTTNTKRPLSQDPIIEMNNETSFLNAANRPHLLINGASNFSSNIVSATGTLSKAQQLNIELENAKNRILTLTHQLNQNVS